MKVSKRIIPLVLVFATLISCISVSVYAEDETEYTGKSSFWTWLASQGDIPAHLVGNLMSGACPESEDGRHHASSAYCDAKNGYYNCICQYCGQHFLAYASDIKQAYDDTVNDMPFTGIDSEGGFIWYPTVADLDYSKECSIDFNKINTISFEGIDSSNTIKWKCVSKETGFIYTKYSCRDGLEVLTGDPSIQIELYFKVPVSGFYTPISNRWCAWRHMTTDGIMHEGSFELKKLDAMYIESGGSIWHNCFYHGYSGCRGRFMYLSWDFQFHAFKVIPDDVLSGSDTYNIDYRPTSIYAPVYYIDNRGQTHITETTIVNEDNSTLYNPVTNETYDMSGWSYDYSTRAYQITTNEGDTVNVTYGDENITIEQGGTTYNVYYTVNNNGGSCVHEYAVSKENPPTCTSVGSRVYTCSKCNDTYSETLPALGHDWQFIETVEAVTDEQGNVTEAAYDLYRCSRCNEEIKVDVGKTPPSGVPDEPTNTDLTGLMKWLEDFKRWLGKLLGEDESPVEIHQDTDSHDITITIEDENGDDQNVSLNDIKAKFQWWRDVADLGQMFLDEVSASEQQAYSYNTRKLRAGAPTGAPSIKVNLGAAESNYGYVYGGEVEMLDLSWYTPYKKDVDSLVSGFLWILFLWNLFKRAPSIISGGEMQESKLDDIDRGSRSKSKRS